MGRGRGWVEFGHGIGETCGRLDDEPGEESTATISTSEGAWALKREGRDVVRRAPSVLLFPGDRDVAGLKA